METSDPTGLRRRAQARLQSQATPLKVPGSANDLERLLLDLQVHQVEPEMQNEELRNTRAREEASAARYLDLYDFAPVGYFTMGRQGEIIQTNLAGARLLGEDRAALVGKRFGIFVSAADRPAFNSHLQQVFTAKPCQTCEVCIGTEGELLRFAHMKTTLARDSQECWAVVVDITERRRAEAVLHKQAEEILDLYDHAPCGYHSLDKNGVIVRINDTELEWLGYQREEVVGKMQFSELLTAGSREVFRVTFPRFKESGVLRGLELDLIRRDGSILSILVNASAILDSDGNLVMSRSTVNDITERKRAEAALQQSARANELLHKSILALNGCADFDSALVCLLQKAIELGGMDCGGAYLIEGQEAVLLHQIGLDPELAAKVARRPLDTGYIKAVLEHSHEVLDVVKQFPEQNYLGQASGLQHVQCVALAAEGKPYGFLIIASRRPEPPTVGHLELIRILALETQSLFLRIGVEERLRSVQEAMTEGIVFQTVDASIIDCNPSAERILGLSRDQILGRTSMDARWQAVREDGRVFSGEEHPAVVSLRTGQSCRDVTMGIHLPDGLQRWISINAEPMFKRGQSRPYAVVATFADITTRRQHEGAERLHQAQKMEAIRHLTGGMAHQFNNILAALMMSLELVQMSSPGADAGELMNEMLKLCQRAAGLIKQLLAFSRQSVMRCQLMDLTAAVSKQCKMLEPLLGERITLQFSSADNLPWVNADKGLVEQIVLNLCLNARDAMKNGGLLRLRLAEAEVGAEQANLHHEAQPGKYVCLSVTDSGCGMDDRTLQRLFEPFFTTKDIGQGTGLGSAEVRGIVQQHGGWVEVESCVGKGSTFKVYLPVPAHVPARPPLPRKAKPVGQGTILLAEDEPGVRKSARKLLEHAGYVVLEAANGVEALALWQEHRAKIDLVYTDMVMPGGLSGNDLAEHVMADKPGVKVIITSGYNTEMPDLSNLTESSVIYLPKPCLGATLISLIQTYLQRT